MPLLSYLAGPLGFQSCLVSMEPLLGLFVLLIVLAALLNLSMAGIFLVFLLVGVLLLALMLLKLRLFLITPMFGLMVALLLIKLLVSPLLALGSLLISLLPVGIIDVGVMLIPFVQLMIFRLVGVSLLFLGLSNLFRELSYGVSFLLYSPLVLSILVFIF